MTMDHEKFEFVQRAKLAEQAERFDDMRDFIKKATELGVGLSTQERNLLSIAYKNVVGTHRASWRIVKNIETKEKDEQDKQDKNGDINEPKQKWLKILKEYREKIESELLETCNDVLKLVDTYLLPNPSDFESTVFYLKMKADYYRYIAEFATGKDRDVAAEISQSSYQEAYDNTKEKLSPIHAIRLGIALNFSVFFYEILDETEKARELAKKALEDALPEADALSSEDYRESALVMQLLRDNLSLWTSDQHDGHEEAEAEAEAGAEDDMHGAQNSD